MLAELITKFRRKWKADNARQVSACKNVTGTLRVLGMFLALVLFPQPLNLRMRTSPPESCNQLPPPLPEKKILERRPALEVVVGPQLELRADSPPPVHDWRRAFRFRVDIDPVPASRPRVTRYGTYIDEPYKSHKVALEALMRRVLQPGENWGLARVDVFLPYPKSWPKSRRLQGAPHRKRPDADNYLKASTDAIIGARMNGPDGDDGQFCVQACGKYYTTETAGYLVICLVPINEFWLHYSLPTVQEEKLAKLERALRQAAA